MESIRVISTSLVQAPNQSNESTEEKIHLTPWDLIFLPLETIQKGLLFQKPTKTEHHHTPFQINNLKHSFSTTLAFFPPLTGRFVITHHNEDKDATCHILCNNQGALFVHAVAENTTVNDILQAKYVPSIVHSFFQLNGVHNHQGTSQPLFAAQVTELVDGVFIGCTLNHTLGDGRSFWHFVNSWAEISRSGFNNKPSKLPSLERAFLVNDVELPIRFPFIEKDFEIIPNPEPPLPERFFHFTKEKIARLKAKANAEAGTEKIKISSLQSLLTHLWISVYRCKRVDPEDELSYFISLGVRPRLVPQLPESYFGNAAIFDSVRMRARELLEGGIGKCALEMNKMIASYTDEKVRSHFESWLRNPTLFTLERVANSNSLTTSSSPRFDVYGNDFGWGKPVAVRSGVANKRAGKMTVFAGNEEGSIDLEVCLSYDILEALWNDTQFTMDSVSFQGEGSHAELLVENF
ncbi:hypothetical protein HN51_001005 [Arachis hypogaea]|uniref:Acetyltransferase n=1 Tax=Arachis hypogaea TaxID=3818 RepID=A0A445ETV0_ARAHY|nr:uncharacterized acetyltransferase At3g50280 isoform X1 [Arachis hypogaea]QHO49031.1 putative acetyltransferase [Arachis hypogaea]RYR78786.1 hypothetical protein Ahy_A01g003642 isoform B [Arachis hypogaea]